MVMLSSERDLAPKQLYLAGKTRRAAMDELGIMNTNSMSSASSRLGLHWSWPMANRQCSTAPLVKPSRKVSVRKRATRESTTVVPLTTKNNGSKTKLENY